MRAEEDDLTAMHPPPFAAEKKRIKRVKGGEGRRGWGGWGGQEVPPVAAPKTETRANFHLLK